MVTSVCMVLVIRFYDNDQLISIIINRINFILA